ncbi:hypothetical protein [Streptomyces sp. NBC_01180]|uniref:hypothetical protein n=1 Tax=Streptomyces sp. NBC_01180 TaxID=2903763 RepID=UPI00386F8B6F|nr:hypothetical protein OG708_21235 [Streptomyces sp. NBC_01180]
MSRLALVACAVSGLFLVAGVPSAWAGVTVPGGGRESTNPTGGSSKNEGSHGTIAASASGVTFDRSKNGSGPAAGPVAAAGNWTPPACWYAPKYTAAQFKAYEEPIWEAESTGPEWDAQQRKRYVDGSPYKNFNLSKADDGYWWTSFPNENFPPGWDACDKPDFWVDKGAPPPNAQAVSPEILAHLAYAEVRVPGTKVTLAPSNNTKVNLPTWAWLDKSDFKPVSVTASVPVLAIEATTVAKPVSLKLDPGTSDAETYPGSGECTFNGDGSIGTPYVKGDADKTPPCGLTYLRASGSNGPYKLKATITWNISWTGTGQPKPKDLPDGTFGTTQDVTVDEIQAINR